MKWNIVRNESCTFKEDYYIGNCPRKNNEKAKICIHLNGNKYCKTDLDNTFSVKLCSCSLLLEESNNICKLDCPLMKEYKKVSIYNVI